jgi:hypothetical protein
MVYSQVEVVPLGVSPLTSRAIVPSLLRIDRFVLGVQRRVLPELVATIVFARLPCLA